MDVRSLADDLRQRSALELTTLLQLRPDLTRPAPRDITTLAQRAGDSGSVHQCLDELDRFTLQVLETMAALAEPINLNAVIECFAPEFYEPVLASMQSLTSRALVWGGEKMRLVRAARDAIGPYPGGLGPLGSERFVEMATWTPADVTTLLTDAPAEALEVIEQLLWGPPTGAVNNADRYVSIDSATTPIEWLLARHLLVPQGHSSVVLPREVGMALRIAAVGYPAVIRQPAWPSVQPTINDTLDSTRVNAAAAAQVYSVVNYGVDLLQSWSSNAPAVLRKSGVTHKDLTASNTLVGLSEKQAATLIEVLHAAGLLGRDGQSPEAWRPTADFDSWRTDDLATAWTDLARAWLHMPRAPHLVIRAQAGSDAINPLSDQVRSDQAPALRTAVLRVLADAPAGAVISADHIALCLSDRQARLVHRSTTEAIDAVLSECEQFGITGHGALSDMGRCLIDDAPDATLHDTVRRYLPAPVDQVLVQGDFTAVAPGPLIAEAAHDLNLLAEVESTGGATVYRFSASSLARGFQHGWSADQIVSVLQQCSLTPLPQALTYLVHDVERKHGSIQVGAASAYIRFSDAADLARVLADQRAADLGLESVSDAMVMATASPTEVLRFLHSLGLAAIAEVTGNETAINVESPKRSPRFVGSGVSHTLTSSRSDAVVDAIVQSLHPDLVASNAAPAATGAPDLAAEESLALVRVAISAEYDLVIGYVDDSGVRHSHRVTPLRVAAGLITCVDCRDGSVCDIAIARVSGARELGETEHTA